MASLSLPQLLQPDWVAPGTLVDLSLDHLIERFRDRLPVGPSTPVVSLGEGSTPLLEVPRRHRQRRHALDAIPHARPRTAAEIDR